MVKTIRIAIPENKAVHNYSIQSLNSTELAKKQMFKEMAKVSGKAADNLSVTVLPLKRDTMTKATLRKESIYLGVRVTP